LRERILGRTRIRLTELGFGGASIGNLYRHTSDAEAASAVAAALDAGIRYFDTAPHYGLGLSERRLGTALAGHPRDDLVISTKVGRLLVPNDRPTEWDQGGFEVPGDKTRVWDFTRDGILRSVEQSLNRLGMDRVDILYLHDPDQSGIEGAARTGAAALIELRDEGVVGAVGIGSNSTDAVTDLFHQADIDVAMLANRYTLIEQNADRVFEAADGRGIVAVGVFNTGLLATSRPDSSAKYDYVDAPPRTVDRAIQLARAAERHGSTLPNAAIAFPLRNAGVTNVTLGMRTAAQVVRNVALYRDPPQDNLWSDPEVIA
jgi:D-threo-aldose 1-dehydrogenase